MLRDDEFPCFYCGKTCNVNTGGFCSPNHKMKMQKLWNDRDKRGLCVKCGTELSRKDKKANPNKTRQSCIPCRNETIKQVDIHLQRIKKLGIKKPNDTQEN